MSPFSQATYVGALRVDILAQLDLFNVIFISSFLHTTNADYKTLHAHVNREHNTVLWKYHPHGQMQEAKNKIQSTKKSPLK